MSLASIPAILTGLSIVQDSYIPRRSNPKNHYGFKPLLAKSERSNDNPAVFATISARVGSISDNQLGGWYSYRMSKAALNMGMKNLSIEWGRSLKDVCVVVMQPGTVNTQLSAPFQGNVADGQLFSPAYSAECLLEVLSRMTAAQSGSFVDWAGESIPW